MNRDKASASWRPIGYWALTINAALGFPILAVATFMSVTDLGVLAGAYASVLAAWAAAAGIRQWGKHNGET